MLKLIPISLLLVMTVGCLDAYENMADNTWERDGEHEDHSWSPGEIQARLVSDVRYRRLQEKTDLGEDEMEDLEFTDEGPMCREHREEVIVVTFPQAVDVGRKAVREKAYFCPEDQKYWYRWTHVETGKMVWMGPFPSRLKKRTKD